MDVSPPYALPGTPPPSAPPAAPWRDEPPLPPAGLQHERYGYTVPGIRQSLDRRGLVRHLVKHPWTDAVYDAEAKAFVRPEELSGILEDFRRQAGRLAVRDAAIVGAFALGCAGLLAWATIHWGAGIRSLPGVLAVFASAYLVLALHGIRAARRTPETVFARARMARRHWDWVKAQGAGLTWALVIPLGAVFLLAFDEDVAFPRAALVKDAVWEGEVWRMLTGPMLHGGGYHVWMNVSALFALGRIVEAHATRFHLALVFLASVLGGSVLSVLLTPATSVGASGGVMGLVGFLWMLARLRPREVPDDFGERMKYVVGATAVLGVIGLEFIDNAAHLGGLLAGAGMGWLLGGGASRDAPGWLVVAGSLAAAVLWLSMAAAVFAAAGAFPPAA